MAELINKNEFIEKMKKTSRYFDVKFDIEEMSTITETEIRNKAIDEFLKKICEKYTEERKGNYKHYCVNIKNDIAEIAEQLKSIGNSEQLNGWIPVEERLPEHLKSVLVSTLSEEIEPFIAYYSKIDDTWKNASTDFVTKAIITAWQPLPEVYKGGMCSEENR